MSKTELLLVRLENWGMMIVEAHRDGQLWRDG
jgi:hypothetical protein